jgi:hypothetical protein
VAGQPGRGRGEALARGAPPRGGPTGTRTR